MSVTVQAIFGVVREVKKLLSPINWFGGKGMMIEKLVPVLENIPHKRYIEPFGGGASLLLSKKPVEVEVYNDIDEGLYNFFTVVADPVLFEQFHRRVALLPCSRQLYNEYRATWQNETDKVLRAAKWFVVTRQSFGGIFASSWGSVVTDAVGKMAGTCARWISCIERLPQIHARLQRVQIENTDWKEILFRYDTPESLFYLDPPYVHSTRRDREFAHELSDDDHRELVSKLLELKGYAVLSGYPNDIYKPLEDAGWKRTDFQTCCHSVGRTRLTKIQGKGTALRMQPRTESIWVKPHGLLLFK